MKKGLRLKIGITALLVIVFTLAWLYDYLRAKDYQVEVVYVSNTTPMAELTEVVDIDVLITRNGVPCVGHEVEARCDAGTFRAYLNRTDENGIVRFQYIPYRETAYKKAGPVTITLLELSNSMIIEVNVIETYNGIVVQPVA